jgi:hypothetical protein
MATPVTRKTAGETTLALGQTVKAAPCCAGASDQNEGTTGMRSYKPCARPGFWSPEQDPQYHRNNNLIRAHADNVPEISRWTPTVSGIPSMVTLNFIATRCGEA